MFNINALEDIIPLYFSCSAYQTSVVVLTITGFNMIIGERDSLAIEIIAKEHSYKEKVTVWMNQISINQFKLTFMKQELNCYVSVSDDVGRSCSEFHPPLVLLLLML